VKRFIFLSLSIFFSVLIILLVPFTLVIRPFFPFTGYLLGVDKPTSYLVLLGNDTEMRANGGFAGSYAKLFLSSARLDSLSSRVLEFFLGNPIPKPSVELNFQDIYVPNGQLAGHVTPPEPIQQAFGHGTWELANADWEPDFPTSATNIRWFLEKGKEINPDVLSIVNLTTIKQILNQIGSFQVPEYSAQITPDNLYLFLQGKTEMNFFPGSTQKKDTLTAVGQALIKKANSLSITKKLKIAHILYTDLINQNIMIHSSNLSFQSFLEQKKLAGVLSPEAFDTYSLVETNLGANKANQFITRSTIHTITLSPEPITNNYELTTPSIHHSVTVHFSNSSPAVNPNPPIHYGGNYITYLRFYVPLEAKNISVVRSPLSSPPLPDPIPPSPAPITNNYELTTPKYDLTEIGFWQTTPAGGESTISLAYDLLLPKTCHSRAGGNPSNSSDCYTLAILKQHGLVSSPQALSIFGQSYSTKLLRSFSYPITGLDK